MTQAPARTQFHSSALIRTLTALALLKPDEAGGGVAEKMGRWIDFSDAIALSAVHKASPATVVRRGAPAQERVALGEDFARMRLALEHSIKTSCSSAADQSWLSAATATWPLASCSTIPWPLGSTG